MNRKLFVPVLKKISSNTKKIIDEDIFNQTNFFQSIQSIQNRRQSRLYGYFCKNYKYQQLGFTQPDYEAFLNRILTTYFNRREVTASTKTKSEVRGGGRKPWRQKGLGRARAGSSRSPLWKGGGVCFGPKPKSNLPKINKKEYALAIRLLLNLAYKQNRLLIIQPLTTSLVKHIEKTREINNLLGSISKTNSSSNLPQATRVILSQQEYSNFGENLKRASSNLSKTKVLCENELTLAIFTKPVKFVFTMNAFLNTRSKFM
uniref:Large ribosomal subunit protein uL4c n=1 Tax=Eustigmatophyceae sp. Ndem 8/9T-3m6.8 TaxID=2506146 RepID=A0A410D270_9STRA|nr:ribosomal protein L4 [Eustigmatophyceae sp. Ndem 8/9T-3m6.8]QAA11818.1 ribosomal protein L4 [Eustigmatophyceae sp. Ndem 8/9T-3m6.8]